MDSRATQNPTISYHASSHVKHRAEISVQIEPPHSGPLLRLRLDYTYTGLKFSYGADLVRIDPLL
jgi:hypothetical protein